MIMARTLPKNVVNQKMEPKIRKITRQKKGKKYKEKRTRGLRSREMYEITS